MSTALKSCFVVMPISDVTPYESGHFQIVFERLITPACEQAGFRAVRSDQVKKSDYIVIDILKKLLESDLVLCDLSARNPNVMYELGIAHAFNRRVLLIKDDVTERAFDISGLRQVDYLHQLRVDHVESARSAIADAIKETHAMKEGEVNNLLQLLAVTPATLGAQAQLSNETKLILSAIESVNRRVAEVEGQLVPASITSLFERATNVSSGSGATIFVPAAGIRRQNEKTLTHGLRVPGNVGSGAIGVPIGQATEVDSAQPVMPKK